MERVSIKKMILITIATAGILSVALVAPNALQMIKQFSGKQNYNKKNYIKSSLGKLLKNGYIKLETNSEGKKFVSLTKKGEDQLVKYKIGDLRIKRPRRWDKKWRIVIFDIKEKRRETRDLLRSVLNRFGFIKLQNSVWIFPYDCEELIIMLKSDLFVGKDVLYMTVDKIENDKWLKETFGLVK